ncbi:MAG: phosphotransferase [Verrucomicrobiaceae bacterium]|nr:phosphotransferase [Verrucomicrobiaceae bacterium]
MPPEHEALVILTRQQFPLLAEASCEVQAIVKGGSDRHFYRLVWQGGAHPPMVLMVYTMARRDNPKFVPATHRLAALGVNVPKIYAFDSDRLFVWLEDLGSTDLHSKAAEPWSERAPLYQAALREVAKIHAVRESDLSARDKAELEPPFDEALYEWEQKYFLDHFVRGHLGRDFRTERFAAAHDALKHLRQQLARQPRCLVHRDFQSQNIMLREGGTTWFVDYQGLRLGMAEYDLASLLLDPYVTLTDSERDDLLHFYAAYRGVSLFELRESFHLCAAQRLMQALGAYGNLSRNQGKPHFKQHIPAAVANLTAVCKTSPLLRELMPLFD